MCYLRLSNGAVGLKEIRNNTPLNPLLLEGALVGRFCGKGVQKQRCVVFGRILEFLKKAWNIFFSKNARNNFSGNCQYGFLESSPLFRC